MKAYLLKGIGDFIYTDADKPACGSREVTVRVRTAGICGSDIPRIFRTGTYSYPLIPGHEFSGIVSETGGDVDRSWLGKRVGVFPLIPCGRCVPCMNKRYELCKSYDYLGSRSNGGFAEYVSVPEWNLIELPENVSFEQAAMLEPMAVAVHALRRSGVLQGQTAAICGLGTIGMLLYMILMEKGVKKIYLIGNKACQEKMAAGLGADMRCFCNDGKENADRWFGREAGPGVDVFFDCAGAAGSVGLALRHTAPGGTITLVGNPVSDMLFDRQTYWKILRNQLTVKGIWNSSFTHDADDDWHCCLDLISEGRIMPERLISHRVPFDRIAEAVEMMRDKKEGYTKVMAVVNA